MFPSTSLPSLSFLSIVTSLFFLSVLSLGFMNLPFLQPTLARGRVTGIGWTGLKILPDSALERCGRPQRPFRSLPGLVPGGDGPPHPVCGLCVEELGAAEGR